MLPWVRLMTVFSAARVTVAQYSLVQQVGAASAWVAWEAGPGKDWNSKRKWWHTVRSRQNVSHCPGMLWW